MIRLLIFATVLVSPCLAQEDVDKLRAEANPAIQEQLAKVRSAFRPGKDASNNVEVFGEIQKLKELTDDDAELVKQVAIFAVARGDESQPMIGNLILYYLRPLPAKTIPVLAPYLDTKNEALHAFVVEWFQSLDKGDSGELEAVNFKEYFHYVQQTLSRGQEVPAPFIRYLYQRSPGRALLVFSQGSVDVGGLIETVRENHQAIRDQRPATWPEQLRKRRSQETRQIEGQARREVALAEHIISNAIWLNRHGFPERFKQARPEAREELMRIAKGEWWARLYVVWVMRKYPEIRQDDLWDQLSKDSEEIVKQAAK
jgi:hypothetical protein